MAGIARKSIAYLGPPGTYGEQAATKFAKRLGGEIELVPCPNIKSIYTHPAPYLVLPLENTLHGVVLDTVDSLLSPLSSSSPFPQIIADTSLRISHHLVARAGTPLSAITEVRSHEQALGQSAAWLTANLPKAARVPWPSTAGALTSILDESTDTAGVAAICSRAAWERERARLELLCEGTQGVKDNFTRFVLLAREPTPIMTCAGRYARFFATRSPAIVGALSGVGELLSVHQRPAPAGTAATTFPRHMPRWTLVEVEAQPDAETPQGALDLGAVWTFEPAETEDTGVPEAELSDAAEQQFMGSGAL